MAFKRMEDNLRGHNSFHLAKQERIHPATNNNNVINVLATIVINPNLSTRQLNSSSIE